MKTMRGFLSILAVSLILIGAGSVLTAPAATETHSLDLAYEVQDMPIDAAAPAPTQKAVVPDVSLASAGACANGYCPYVPRVATLKVQQEQTKTVTTTETAACSECNERSRRHPVARAVCGAGKAVGGILGHDRRAARRAARRGG